MDLSGGMTSALYPFLIEPRLVPLIWGGDALVRQYGKAGDPAAKIGETWECWDENRVRNGVHAGKTIAALRAELGSALMGTLDVNRRFPILTKVIDARAALSVQVHPDDGYAQRVEGEPFGKTECWLILSAEPGATLVLGWRRDTDRAEFERRVADGTLGDVLRSVPVAAGDAFYVPAGTLHAVGAGIVLFEVQQASDLTYRIFDWNRLGADGKPRRLHVEKAADVLDFAAARRTTVQPLEYATDGLRRAAFVADAHFVFERLELDEVPRALSLDGVPFTLTATGAPVEIVANGFAALLAPYATAIVPAGAGRCTLRAIERTAAPLAATPVAGAASARLRYERAGVEAGTAGAFLAQFHS
jgi:mannose-6-phosphate isomerase